MTKKSKCFAVSLDCLQTQPKTKFYCCGVVTDRISSHLYTRIAGKGHGMDWHSLDEHSEIEVGAEADENENYSSDPRVPYSEKIPDGLHLGKTIEIEGKVFPNSDRFAVNVTTEKKEGCDVFFHFNPRFNRRIVVRNHRRRGSWGEEEISAGRPFPFQPGRGLRLTLFVADGKIMVAVNFKHFCGFSFRMPIEQARYLEVEGDISVTSVRYYNATVYPILPPSRQPRVIAPPWRLGTPLTVRRKTKKIEPGSVVEISGRVKLLPQGFYVNLQGGACLVPHPIIPLHINLRLCQPGLQEQQMIYNSWVNGSWGSEIKPKDCPFLPGMVFILKIIYLEEGFHVSVNGDFLIAFPLRLPYPPILDTVLVDGDVIITKVRVSANAIKSVKTK